LTVKVSNPVQTISRQSRPRMARMGPRKKPRIQSQRTSGVEATTNRMPAKVRGGRSARPILMNSQVLPQTVARRSQTRTGRVTGVEYTAAEPGGSPANLDNLRSVVVWRNCHKW